MKNIHLSYSAIIPSPVGYLGIKYKDDQLTSLTFLSHTIPTSLSQTDQPPQTEYYQRVVAELSAYFKNPHHLFTLDLHLQGTPFQKRVWQALRDIPSSETRTYGQLAQQLKTGPRAIGQACRTNPIGIIVPCHRVTAMHNMGGFAGKKKGAWMEIKKWLLAHEKGD